MEFKFCAKVYIQLETGDWALGTGYPIAKGLVLTAHHVVCPEANKGEFKKGEIVWEGCKDSNGENITAEITDIKFDGKNLEGEKFDIVVVACNTPPEFTKATPILKNNPNPGEDWDCVGYPKADETEQENREETPDMGTFYASNPNKPILHLKSEGRSDEEELWKGMSGAFIFERNSDSLAAILTSVSTSTSNKVFAVSIPYLLRFSEFKKAIGFDQQNQSELLPKIKLGDEFKQLLHKQIATELKRPEAQCLAQQLANYLEIEDTKSIIDRLLECKTDAAIRDYLTLAAADCLCPSGERFHDVGENFGLTRKVAEQILGWLVLAGIDEQQLEQIYPCCTEHDSLFFEIAVNTLAGAEVVLSRRFAHEAVWPDKITGSPQGRHSILAQDSWFKWQDEETVRKILIEIWNQVFDFPDDRKKADDALTGDEIKILNAHLRSRRIRPRDKEHYYIAFKLPKEQSNFPEIIYKELLKGNYSDTCILGSIGTALADR